MRNEHKQPAGCGVEGCLTAAVILFVVLLIGMLILVSMRLGPRF